MPCSLTFLKKKNKIESPYATQFIVQTQETNTAEGHSGAPPGGDVACRVLDNASTSPGVLFHRLSNEITQGDIVILRGIEPPPSLSESNFL